MKKAAFLFAILAFAVSTVFAGSWTTKRKVDAVMVQSSNIGLVAHIYLKSEPKAFVFVVDDEASQSMLSMARDAFFANDSMSVNTSSSYNLTYTVVDGFSYTNPLALGLSLNK